MTAVIEKNHSFKYGEYTAIPYQHYKFPFTWDVSVWKDGKHQNIRTVAPRPMDAAIRAIDQFDKFHEEREEVKRLNKMDKEDILEEEEDGI